MSARVLSPSSPDVLALRETQASRALLRQEERPVGALACRGAPLCATHSNCNWSRISARKDCCEQRRRLKCLPLAERNA